jgi:hypothetical protein
VEIPGDAILKLLSANYNVTPDSPIALYIVAEGHEIKARDFISLLDLIDRAYGEASPRGIYSYGRNEASQLVISEIRSESPLTLIVSELHRTVQLGVVLVVLRFLPDLFVKGTLSYKQYWEGREAKQHVQHALDENQQLASLTKEERAMLIDFLTQFLQKYQYALKRVARLREKHKMSERLEIKDSEEQNGGH